MLEGVYLNRNGNFTKGTSIYFYKDSCIECEEPYLTEKSRASEFCSRSCAIKGERSHRCGKKGELHPLYGKSGANKGRFGVESPRWRGGVVERNVPLYNTYANRLIKYGHEVRHCSDDELLVEVACKKCEKWFLPTMISVVNRISCVENGGGESQLYCSDKCKDECEIYGQNPDHLMLRAGVSGEETLTKVRNTEMQLSFRNVLITRSNGVCEICGNDNNESMIAHHITPVKTCNDITTWDFDNGLYLCANCERRAHSDKGCRYVDLANH